MWRDGAVSIVLFSTRPQGEELLALVREWTRHGIISPAAWVFPDGIVVGDGPPRVTATLIDVDDERALIEQEVDLFEMLALEEMSRVRVVKLRSPSVDAEADDHQDDLSDVVARYVALSMPQVNPLGSGDTDAIDLDKMSLICTPTQVQLDERLRGAENDSSVVVVASPEDRATPNAGDAFVRENERFGGFVLMHLATLAGLWKGAPVGTLELFDRESSATQSIWMQRVFVRGVLTGGISRRAAADVLGKLVEYRGAVSAAGVTVTPDGTSAIPDKSVPRYVDSMVEAGMDLDDSALAFRQPAVESAPTRAEVGVWEQLGLFLRFAGGKISRMPHWTSTWIHDAFARRVGQELQGEEGLRQVQLLLDQDPDSHDARLLLAMQRLQRQRLEPTFGRSARSRPAVHSAPRLWSGLRKIVFSAVDGSSGPAGGGFAEIDGRAPVFDSLSPIAPDPRTEWRHPAPPDGFPERVTWTDVRHDRTIETRLAETRDEAVAVAANWQAVATDAEAERVAAEAARDELRGRLVDAGLIKVRSDGRVTLVKAPKDATAEVAAAHKASAADWPRANDRCRTAAREAEKSAEQFQIASVRAEWEQGVLDSFLEWVEDQRSTFVARLADRMDASREHAAREVAREESGELALPEPRELVRLRKSFHLGAAVTTFVVAVATAIVIALRFPNSDEARQAIDELVAEGRYPEWWVALLMAAGIWLVVILLLLTRYYRGWSTFSNRVRLAEHVAHTRGARLDALRGELERLESIHQQADEWIDLITAALYDPWEVPAEWTEGAGSGLNPDVMPFAMSIGEAVEGVGTGADRITRDAAEEIVRRGWRDAAFRELLNEIADRLGLDRSELDPDALDADVPDAPNNSRSLVRQYMGKRDVLEAVAARELAAIADGLQEDVQAGERISVAPLRRADPMSAFQRTRTAESTRGWSDFLLEPVSASPVAPPPLSALAISTHRVQQAHHQDVASYVVGPEPVVDQPIVASRPGLVSRALPSDSGTGFDVLVRVDVVGPVPLDAVHALGGGRSGYATPVSEVSPNLGI